MKPKGLKETAIIMGVFNIAGYIFVNPKSQYFATELALATAIILLSYVMLWYYWCGKNWARVLVILNSLLSVYNLTGIRKHTTAQAALIAVEAIMGLYLLWWLNTCQTKSYFKRLKKDA